jgi:hypothetical protein
MSVSGFTTVPYVAAVGHQGACSPSDISAFVTACGSSASVTACDTWQTANVASEAGAGTPCGNCIITPIGANNGGTWSDVNGYFLPNYAGCIQLTDLTEAGTACATAVDNRQGCEGLACDMCTSGQACVVSADMGGCSQYVSAFNGACTGDLADGGAVATCSAGAANNNPDLDLSTILTLICGGGDAGTTDAGTTEGGTTDGGGGD